MLVKDMQYAERNNRWEKGADASLAVQQDYLEEMIRSKDFVVVSQHGGALKLLASRFGFRLSLWFS